MAFKLYNPKTKVFAPFNTSDSSDLTLTEVLLINILIELKAQTHLILSDSPNIDEPSYIRTDIVSDTQ